ncbi:restriction endonuclease [Skermania piniformis]|uniref:Restriction endonuclease n=1 Tax=Skermania pinensis TaxID=39122 RepID=A0ABX8S4B0_9ACTN|nr:restriction endonuclease [Skermania piniformis]QXQ12670.1 restriction endonuclease [Skermania piniformis]
MNQAAGLASRELTLDAWLTRLAAADPDHEHTAEGIHYWAFPSDALLTEYLATCADRTPTEVRDLLRWFLFDCTTFGADHDIVARMARDPISNAHLSRHKEYYRRLPEVTLGRIPAHQGVRWALDLLPDHPQLAVTVIESYLVAAWDVLPQGRIHGLQDAVAVIGARFRPADHAGESIQSLRTISPHDFELLVGRLYEEYGYKTVLTDPAVGGGRDIEATMQDGRREEKLLLFCRHNCDVTTPDQAELLVGAARTTHAAGGVLVTSAPITDEVRALAATHRKFEVVGGEQLVELLNEAFGAQWPNRLDALLWRSRREPDQ